MNPFNLPGLNLEMPQIDNSVFEGIQETMDRRAGRLDAEAVFQHLLSKVDSHQAALSADEELGLQLANFGEAAQIHIREIGYQNPNIIEFTGLNTQGHRVTLLQHISQLNFMLIALKPVEEQPYRIGFKTK